MTIAPQLVIFDIDATLLAPNQYISPDHVRQGLYDDQLLTFLLTNPEYQVAIASYNHDLYGCGPLHGRRLGRVILDLQHPSGSSYQSVEDDFIQAWAFPTMELMNNRGKNEHIGKILEAYYKKYGRGPSVVFFYDDHIHNVYLAGKNGIRAYWVTAGLSRDNIHTFTTIGNRVQFATDHVCDQLEIFAPYIHKHPQPPNTTPIYSLYLSFDRDIAKSIYTEFLKRIQECGIMIHILTTDLNHIV